MNPRPSAVALLCRPSALIKTAPPGSRSQTCLEVEQSHDLHPYTDNTLQIAPLPAVKRCIAEHGLHDGCRS